VHTSAHAGPDGWPVRIGEGAQIQSQGIKYGSMRRYLMPVFPIAEIGKIRKAQEG